MIRNQNYLKVFGGKWTTRPKQDNQIPQDVSSIAIENPNVSMSTYLNFITCTFLTRCYFWPLCCLFFFDIRILITPLVSSNSSSRSFQQWWKVFFFCHFSLKARPFGIVNTIFTAIVVIWYLKWFIVIVLNKITKCQKINFLEK
jgi:hypothetical protein